MELQLYEIQNRIYEIRGRRVMLDFDIAEVFEVETRRLKEQVRRNIERFPDDFMLRLTHNEANHLIITRRSQNAIPLNYNIGASEMFAFTQEGIAMLSGVLRSPIAIQANINIMRAFVAVREYLSSIQHITAELSAIRGELKQLERADEENLRAINDLSEDMQQEIDNLYLAIGTLSVRIPQLNKPHRPIGFKRSNDQT